jgi:hypothetical protein
MTLACRRFAVALVVALAALAPSARAQLTADDRAALGDLGPSFAQRFELKRGWYRGHPIQYFDVGPQDPTIAPVFLFATGIDADGMPRLVPDQRPVFSSIPGLAGYSAIWQVHYVVVGPGYTANRVRDAREALGLTLRGSARLVIPGTFLNLSIVPAGSSLNGDPDQRPLKTGWFKGAEVPYFDFGWTLSQPAPIYPFVTGFAGDTPQFLRAQANVVDVVPDSAGPGRDLWDVMFVEAPAGYEPDAVRDRSAIVGPAARSDLHVRRGGQVRNCPVVIVDGRRAPRTGLALP